MNIYIRATKYTYAFRFAINKDGVRAIVYSPDVEYIALVGWKYTNKVVGKCHDQA